MVCSRKRNITLAFLGLILLIDGNRTFAQPTANQFHELLTEKAFMTAAELSDLDSGRFVVKILPAKTKREIAVFGIVRVDPVENVDMPFFRASLNQRSNRLRVAGGVFSTTPTLDNLAMLNVEDKDLEDLQRCVVGRCGVKVSAKMIKELQAEVDWNAADAKQKATNVFKRLLIDHVQVYLDSGDSGLAAYVDHWKPVRLAEENRILLERSVFIKAFAPELDLYLQAYPKGELPGVEHRLDWSNVDSGLKPVITITHGMGYSKQSSERSVLMIVTKQIYASHYLDASLALSSFVSIGTGTAAERYLVFTNLSSSDALGGALGGIARTIAEREAIEKVMDLLESAKLELEAPVRDQDEHAPDAVESESLDLVAGLTGNWFFRVGVFILAAAVAIFLFRRRRK